MPDTFSVTLRGINFSCLRWQSPEAVPLLAIHGWLDNAASWAVLAPLLAHCDVVAPDLAGNGQSDHRPAASSYNIWDDLPDLKLLVDWLGWSNFHLIGHSRGAAVATLLALALPDRVKSLVLLDGFMPQPLAAADCAAQLGRFVADITAEPRSPRLYPNLEEAVSSRAQKADLSMDSARLLAARGTQRSQNSVFWHFDSRQLGASSFKFSEQQVQSMLSGLTVPTLVLLAAEGLAALPAVIEQCENCPVVDWQRLPGGHHMHMMEEHVRPLANRILQFIQREEQR